MTTSTAPPHGLLGFIKSFATSGFAASAVIGAIFAYISGDWIILPALVLIWLFWRALPSDGAPPGLQFSFSFHLFQIVAGVLYTSITGRFLLPHQAPQYHTMMVMAVACVLGMFAAFLAGDRWLAKRRAPISRVQLDVTLTQLVVVYALAIVSRDTLVGFVNTVPAFAQAILALSATQMALLYLVLRKLFREHRYALIILVVGFETVRGFGGFYSSFKEPLILALIAGMEVFQPRKAAHWALTALLVFSAVGLSVVWLGIRGAIRQDITNETVVRNQTERLRFALDEFREWWTLEREEKMHDVDALVERVWDVYYSAMALDRVPALIPHEDGAILWSAAQHVLTPRFLNPDKPPLPSESDDVNRYSGVRVAGREQGTTIAFGYVIQSYIDFGVPWMIIPSIAFGLLMGVAYRFYVTTIRHEDLLIAVLAVAFWANVMPYNVSWAKMIGKLITALVYIGGAAIVLDHVLYTRRLRRLGALEFQQQQQQQQQQRPPPPQPARIP